MKTELKKMANSEVELVCGLEFSEFAPFIETALKKLAADLELPGFRKGKAPLELVKDKIGALRLYEEAAEAAVQSCYPKILNEHKLEPLGRPEISVLKLAPENDFEFKIRLAVLPEVKLPDYPTILKSLKDKRRKIEVEPAQVAGALEWLRKSRAETVASEQPSQLGDLVTIDLFLREQGVLLEQGEQQDFVVRLGETKLLEGVEEKLIGVRPGEAKKFEQQIPQDYWNKQLAGKTIEIELLVKEVSSEKLPELNDEFASQLGKFQNLAELTNSVQDGLRLEAEQREKQRFQLEILKTLAKQTKFELPEVLVQAELESLVHNLQHSIEETGLGWDAYLKQIGKTDEELHREFRSQAEERVELALLVDALVRKEQIQVPDEEVREQVNKYLAAFKTPQEAEERIDPESLIAYTKDMLRNDKLNARLEQIVFED